MGLTRKRTGNNAETIRKLNRRNVYGLILRHGVISRTELVALTELRPPTISSIMRELVEEGLVENCGKGAINPNGGPAPELYRISNTNKYFIGIDVGHTHITSVLVDPSGQKCFDSIEITHAIKSDQGVMLSAIDDMIEHTLDKIHAAQGIATGIGISCVALVDNDTGDVALSTLPALNGVHFNAHLKEKFGLPIYVDNNINVLLAAVRGTSHELSEASSVLCLGIWEGIGMSIIAENRLYRGARNLSGNTSLISDIPNLLTFPDAKDEVAVGEWLDRFVCALGYHVANFLHIFDSEYVVMCSPIFSWYDGVFERVVAASRKICSEPYQNTVFIPMPLNGQLLAESAAQCIFYSVFDVPI